MRVLQARVREGKLVLDEPADLPEGAEARVVLFDDLDEAERARLDDALEEAEREFDAGEIVSEDELWVRLRAGP